VAVAAVAAVAAVVAAAAQVAAAVSVEDTLKASGVHTHFFFPNCNQENQFLFLFIISAVFNLS
jgi:hypothetical protein